MSDALSRPRTGTVVALTASTRMMDGLERVRLNEAYVTAIREAGLTPFIVAPMDPSDAAPILDAVAGVVFTGGEDVDPSAYGARRAEKTYDPHARRDAFELALARGARDRRIPTLAICRGLQLMNVALGGTLVQDIGSECPDAIPHDRSDSRTDRVHDISVEPSTHLAAAVDGERMTVNSSHHQALARVADGLRVNARSPDRIIEGAEWAGDEWWMLGVQWHPEELVHTAEPWDRRLFEAFAAEVLR
jgi:putative glutamine amidotransferase